MNKAEAAARLRFAMKERGVFEDLKKSFLNYVTSMDPTSELVHLRRETVRLLRALGYTFEDSPLPWIEIFGASLGYEKTLCENGWPTGEWKRVA